MKKSMIKTTFSACLILSAITLSSCASKSYSKNDSFAGVQMASDEAVYDNSRYENAALSDNDYESENYENEVEAATVDKTELPDQNNPGNDSISKEMLVYKCSMNIDVLDYKNSIEEYKKLVNKYSGFVECENYSDGGQTSKWIYENDERFSSYSATVRIPSKDYDNFCNELEQIGDLRNKNASVDNLSQEYSDLNTTLKVYEAKEKRYIDLLSTIQEDQYAIEVERELTNIQTEIARIKTRMNSIKEDVAYSYIDVRISEVKEYTEHVEPPKTKTFVDRLKNTVIDTLYGFLNFLENLLFFIIGILPYVLVFGIIFIVLKKVIKALINRSKARKEKKKAEKALKSGMINKDTPNNINDKSNDITKETDTKANDDSLKQK